MGGGDSRVKGKGRPAPCEVSPKKLEGSLFMFFFAFVQMMCRPCRHENMRAHTIHAYVRARAEIHYSRFFVLARTCVDT